MTRQKTHIEHIVCSYYSLKPADIHIRRRTRNIVWARQVYMHFIRKAGYGLEDIGLHFGYDHTTVIYATKLVEDLCFAYADKRNEILFIGNLIENSNFNDLRTEYAGC